VTQVNERVVADAVGCDAISPAARVADARGRGGRWGKRGALGEAGLMPQRSKKRGGRLEEDGAQEEEDKVEEEDGGG
jgi:hypothetical protein